MLAQLCRLSQMEARVKLAPSEARTELPDDLDGRWRGVEGNVKMIFSVSPILRWSGFASVFRREQHSRILDPRVIIEKGRKTGRAG